MTSNRITLYFEQGCLHFHTSAVREWSFITGRGEGIRDFAMGLMGFFLLKNGVLEVFSEVLNFTNFLKDVIFYVEQLKLMVLAYSKGELNIYIFFL